MDKVIKFLINRYEFVNKTYDLNKNNDFVRGRHEEIVEVFYKILQIFEKETDFYIEILNKIEKINKSKLTNLKSESELNDILDSINAINEKKIIFESVKKFIQ